MIPTSIDGTDITGATIDGTDVQEITVDGQTVFSAGPPLPTTGLVHRYDATDTSSLTNTSGGPISNLDDVGQWDDLVGSANYVDDSVGGSSTAPQFVTSGINGLPSIEFDADDEWLINYQSGNFTNISQPNDFFVVHERLGDGTANERILDSDGGSGGRQIVRMDDVRMFAGSYADVTFNPTVPGISTFRFDDANSEYYFNGDQKTLSGSTGTNGLSGHSLGAWDGNNHEIFAYIGELVFYDRQLSTTEREDAEAALAAKWGITL